MINISMKLYELRNSLFHYVRNIVPKWPKYVVKELLYNSFSKEYDESDIKGEIFNLLKVMDISPDTEWKLSKVHFTMDMWEPETKERLVGRLDDSDFGQNMGIPKDKERHATQAKLLKQTGISAEPIIMLSTNRGYELFEGWHRTIQHFKKYPKGYSAPAYVAKTTK